MADADGSIEPDEPDDTDDDPHVRIAQHEARIEELADRIERCRKIIFAAKISIVLGAATLLVLLMGGVHSAPVVMMVAVIAFLGGIVVSGTNASTAKQMAAEMAHAEAQRSALIDQLDLRLVPDGVDG